MGNDIKYMPEKLEQASNFANKIWNVAKFIIMNSVEEEKIIQFYDKNFSTHEFKEEILKAEDKWILNKLNKLISEVTRNIENYDLGIALDKIYSFIKDEFCDWYIEMIKPRVYSENEEEKIKISFILDYIFGISMKLLHPFMPFISTEIDKNLVRYNDKELMISKWPKAKSEISHNDIIEQLKDIIVEIRNIRAKMNIHPTKKTELIFVTKKYVNEIKESEEFIKKLGFAQKITIQSNKDGISENAISIIKDEIELYLPQDGLIDLEEEAKRKQKEIEKMQFEIQRAEKMLNNPGFINKAPKEKIEEEREKLEKYKRNLSILLKE